MYTTKDGMKVGSSWEELGVSVPLGKTGTYKTLCPSCSSSRKPANQKDPCLSVMISDQYAKCHNCGGEFLIDKQGYQALQSQKEYKTPPQREAYDGVSLDVMEWFETERAISEDTLRVFKVTSGKAFMPQVGEEVETTQFNYYEHSNLVNIKYRDENKNFRMYGGAKLIFYNIDALYNTDDYIVITEGEIDALSYHEAGISKVISVPNGASKGSMNLEYLNHHFHLFEEESRKKSKLGGLKKIVLAFDEDDAGYSLRKEFVRRLGADRCWFADLQGFNDPNELLKSKGKTALYNSFDKARPAPFDDVKTVYDLRDELEHLRKEGLKPGAQVGSEQFQERMSFEQPRMTIITGISTHGKSEFLDDIVTRLSVHHNWRFGVFSPENFPIEYHISKLVSKITGKAFNDVDGLELQEAYDYIAEHFFWIYPEDDNYTLDNILRISDLLISRYGINGLIIDPWTEIDKLGKNGTEDINEYLSIMNRYKRNKNIHMFLVAHPTKMGKDQEGKVLVPGLMDISGSGHFYNKTDGGITVYRDFENDTVDVYVNKIKFKHLGRTGRITLMYNLANGRYQDRIDVDRNSWDDSNWLHKEEQMRANLEFGQPTITTPTMEREDEDDLPF
jgi:twinkle protein